MPQIAREREYYDFLASNEVLNMVYQAMYSERQTIVRAYDYLSAFCRSNRVHFIYGKKPDYV